MNRTILIVICDFLLVSLLAFSTVDINKVADEGTPRNVQTQMVTNQMDSGKDLTAVMRMALEEERKNRDQLLGELTRSRETAGKQQTILTEHEKQLQNFQQELQAKEQKYQQELQARDQQTQKLQQLQTGLQQEEAGLQTQLAAAQTNMQALNARLQASTAETVLSREKLAAMEAEMRKQSDQAATLQQQLARLQKSNDVVLSEKQQLANQLQVAEVERRHATEQVARMQDEVKAERDEKAKLAEGVKTLAAKSGQLEQEIRENQALAPNTVYSDFVTNRVEARFEAFRSGLIDTRKRREAATVLVSNGTNTYAVCHVQDTPLALSTPGTEWESLTGNLGRANAVSPIQSLSFHMQDPRIVLIPVSDQQAQSLGCKVYRLSANPFKFQDAVLVGTREDYYGECKFELDVSTPEYLKLDHGFMRGLFGKFNPSRGDLVFSRTGELLGIMANSTYCLMLHSFEAAGTLQFGSDVRAQHTGTTLSLLYAQLAQMPPKLQ
jgi:hypothetical protein